MTLLAVSVIGRDRPGIVADVTAALARRGGNLEDSSMTLLGGHFAMMLLVSTPEAVDAVRAALAPLGADGSLQVAVREIRSGADADSPGRHHVLRVHGPDRPGIVAAVTGALAAAGGNVTDLSTRLSGQLFLLVAEVDLPDAADVDELAGRLREVAAELGLDASLDPAEADLL